MQNNPLNPGSALNSGGLTTSGYIPNQFTPANYTPIPQAPVTVNVAPPIPAPTAPTTSTPPPASMVAPEQASANAMFKDQLNKSINTGNSIPSNVLSTTATPTSVVSTADKAFQDYLIKQQSYQDKILGAITPSQAEKDLIAQQRAQKIQAMQNQEIALNSGETSSFAGGEAQRVARNDAFKSLTLDSQVQTLADQRATALKGLELLSQSNDNSYEAQLKYQTLQNTVGGIDKQAQDTFFNLAQQNPSIPYTYDRTKSAVDNLNELRNLVAKQPDTLSSAKTQQVVSQIVSQFDNEPVVKNYNVVAEGYQFARNLADKPKLTSADNIGIIYAFAKAMDPGSVVREGEYATIQKYAQAWAESFGFNAQRILSNKEFLTDEAVANLISTMDAKYAASEKSYRNIESEYNRKITEAKNGSVSGSLTDYSRGYTASGTPKAQTGTVIKTKVGDINTDW